MDEEGCVWCGKSWEDCECRMGGDEGEFDTCSLCGRSKVLGEYCAHCNSECFTCGQKEANCLCFGNPYANEEYTQEDEYYAEEHTAYWINPWARTE